MWEYRAAPVRVVDGDSLILLCDTGFGGRQEEEFRLLDVHAPERSEPGGREATAFAEDWLSRLDMRRRWPLLVRTVPNTSPEPGERRTFTRYLARVWRYGEITPSLNDEITAFLAGHPEWGPGQ